MATFTTFGPYLDLIGSTAVQWKIISTASGSVTLENGLQQLSIQGNFAIGPAGAVSGTATSVLLTQAGYAGLPVFQATDLTIDAGQFLDTAIKATTDTQIWAALLAGSDTIVGSAGRQRANGVSAARSSVAPASASKAPNAPPAWSPARSAASPAVSGIGDRAIGSPASSIVSRTAAIRAAASAGASGRVAARAWSPGSMRPPGNTKAPPANAIALARSTINSCGGAPSTSRRMTTVAAGIASCIVRHLGTGRGSRQPCAA